MAGKAAKTTKSKAKKDAPAPEVVEDELEEVEGDDEETTTKSAQKDVTFGASDLAKYLSEKSGKAVSARELRTLIRKMARDGSKRVNREIVAGNRSRYDWSGVDDPEVQAIIAAFEGGELEADKKEKLDALKARKEEKKAAKAKEEKGKGAKGKKGKKAEPVATEGDEDEDLELDD